MHKRVRCMMASFFGGYGSCSFSLPMMIFYSILPTLKMVYHTALHDIHRLLLTSLSRLDVIFIESSLLEIPFSSSWGNPLSRYFWKPVVELI